MSISTTPESFSLDELCVLTDLAKRTVRYYVQIGLVNRPHGETRAARYDVKHLEQLLLIKKWTAAGVSLERIHDLLQGEAAPVPPRPRTPGAIEVCSHVLIADGIEQIAIMANDEDGGGTFGEIINQPECAFQIEIIGGLIEQQ